MGLRGRKKMVQGGYLRLKWWSPDSGCVKRKDVI